MAELVEDAPVSTASFVINLSRESQPVFGVKAIFWSKPKFCSARR
jgi:hypothetical protein